MFKGFSKKQAFNGFVKQNFQLNNEAYGFSGCTLLLDAGNFINNGNPSNLDLISSWKSVINDVVFLQSVVANQFRFHSSIAAFNNLPAIYFQGGTSKFMTTNTPVGLGGFTIAFVVQRTDIINQANVICHGNGSSASLAFSDHFSAAGNFTAALTGYGFYNSIGSATAKIASTVEDTNPHIVIITNNTICIDGVVVVSGGNAIPFGSINALGYNNAAGPLGGYLAEMIIYSNLKLNEGECLELSNRLNTKYAIY